MENPMVDYSKLIAETASNHYNVRDEYKQNTYEQNVAISLSEQRKFSVGCINVTGCLNIGIIIRTSLLMGAESIYLFGRNKFDRRSCVGSENYITINKFVYDNPLSCDEELVSQLEELEQKHTIVLCELGGHELQADNLSFYNQFTKPPLFLFGSESHGVPQLVLDKFPFKISIPQRGVLRSYNVSTAASIIVYDYVKTMFFTNK